MFATPLIQHTREYPANTEYYDVHIIAWLKPSIYIFLDSLDFSEASSSVTRCVCNYLSVVVFAAMWHSGLDRLW